jgi:hypothetical protein
MKTTVKLTFLVGAITLTTTVSGWAQVQNRILTTPQTAAKPQPVKPGETPSLIIVNDNIVSYLYVPTATDPGAGKTPKNVLSFTHFDIWNYGTNFFNLDWLKATNGSVVLDTRRSTVFSAARWVGTSFRVQTPFRSVHSPTSSSLSAAISIPIIPRRHRLSAR